MRIQFAVFAALLAFSVAGARFVNPKTTTMNLQSLLYYQVFNNFNRFERLSLGTFNQGGIMLGEPGNFENLDQVRRVINATKQYTASPVIWQLFQSLIYLAPTQLPMDQTFIIFTGKFNQTDAKEVDHYAEQIKRDNFLAIIGTQSTIDVNVLNKVADYAYTLDLDKGLPVVLHDVIEKAFGCGF